jgi:hypothetical protein
MTDVLIRIKRAVLTGNYRFSEKALIEMDCERLIELDIVESISTAVAVYKKIRSTSPHKGREPEYLYIIHSSNFHGMPIYTKGKFVKENGRELYYFFISSKCVSFN